MRLVASLAVAVAVAAGAAPAIAAPAGATAKCRDGTYSFSTHHSGTCSHHGGVAVWLNGSGSGSGSTHTTSSAVSPAVRTLQKQVKTLKAQIKVLQTSVRKIQAAQSALSSSTAATVATLTAKGTAAYNFIQACYIVGGVLDEGKAFNGSVSGVWNAVAINAPSGWGLSLWQDNPEGTLFSQLVNPSCVNGTQRATQRGGFGLLQLHSLR